MNKSRQLRDGALLTAIYIVLLLVSIFIPVLSVITMLLLAVPFIIFAAKYDWKPSLIMLGVATILSILFASIMVLPIPIVVGIGGVMIGTAIHRELTPYETWARGTIGFAVGLLLTFVFLLSVLNINVIEEFSQQADEVLELSKDMANQLGMEADAEFTVMEQQLNLYKQLVPVFVVLASLLLALLNQWVSYKILNRLEKQRLRFPKFRNLRFPTAILWIYLLAMILILFQGEQDGTLVVALQNVMMLTGLFMAIQGFSFIFFISHHKNISIAIPIVLVVVTLIFAPLLFPLVRILGIIDLGFGLRDRMVK
ncbi:YybS family protein [Ornithinibacillus massiliensis]|uniref:YybS family protein n=1 Tax=Ornithinibacillus massiliensis TaxID=1944633 RepID=A0ABS5M8R6_9BACI|nr:YybS family protein [Ornithinibacillus massiliensis]MBS3678702.1 YybS family protein [Ornithinibacillus massiliensis]